MKKTHPTLTSHLKDFEVNIKTFEEAVGTSADITGYTLKMRTHFHTLHEKGFISPELYAKFNKHLDSINDTLHDLGHEAFIVYDSLTEEQLFLVQLTQNSVPPEFIDR